jgi:hypothetical protein
MRRVGFKFSRSLNGSVEVQQTALHALSCLNTGLLLNLLLILFHYSFFIITSTGAPDVVFPLASL